MNIFVDLEYTRVASPRQPISMGLYAANGRSLYVEFSGVLMHDLSNEAKSVMDNLLKPSVGLNHLVCRDSGNKDCRNIRTADVVMMFKASTTTVKDYLQTWLDSFGEYIDFYMFNTPTQWEILHPMLLNEEGKLPKFICSIPYDLASIIKFNGYCPESMDMEDFTDFKMPRYTAINVAELNKHVADKLGVK